MSIDEAVIAVIKYFGEDSKPMKPLVWLCDLYTTVVRGIPVVVLLLIFFFVVFAKSSNGIAIATLTFGINSGAYMAELVRSGLNAVNIGQMEAGRSLGMSKMQTMRKIILPQAIRYILPAIFNELIALLRKPPLPVMLGCLTLPKQVTGSGVQRSRHICRSLLWQSFTWMRG